MRPWISLLLSLLWLFGQSSPGLAKTDLPRGLPRIEPIPAQPSTQPPHEPKRVALIIGNSEYRSGIPRLPNSRNDADDTAAALRDLGFDVTEKADLDLIGFEDALQQLRLESADAEMVVFYYAGYAIQYGDTNYLIPIDYNHGRPQYLKGSVDMNEIRDALRDTPGAKIMIFDSCRRNPFRNVTTDDPNGAMDRTRGMQSVQVRTSESAILYSARPN